MYSNKSTICIGIVSLALWLVTEKPLFPYNNSLACYPVGPTNCYLSEQGGGNCKAVGRTEEGERCSSDWSRATEKWKDEWASLLSCLPERVWKKGRISSQIPPSAGPMLCKWVSNMYGVHMVSMQSHLLNYQYSFRSAVIKLMWLTQYNLLTIFDYFYEYPAASLHLCSWRRAGSCAFS